MPSTQQEDDAIRQRVLSILKKTGESRAGETVLLSRESTDLEYKETFTIPNFMGAIKTVAGFANNKGGMIIYGVKDKPRIPMGMQNSRFEDTDDTRIQDTLGQNLSGTVKFSMQTVCHNTKNYGVIYVPEAIDDKPIIIKKNGDNFKEGEIYFRYRAQTKLISHDELRKLIEKIVEERARASLAKIEKVFQYGESARVINARAGSHGKSAEMGIGKGTVVERRVDFLDDYPLSATQVAAEVKRRLPECKQNAVWKAIRDNQLKTNPEYSAYRFRNTEHRERYNETKDAGATASTYNDAAIAFLVSKLSK